MIKGKLSFDPFSKRWSIIDPEDRDSKCELTSGSFCELKIGDHWIPTVIESYDGKYYSTKPGTKLCSQLEARIGESWP